MKRSPNSQSTFHIPHSTFPIASSPLLESGQQADPHADPCADGVRDGIPKLCAAVGEDALNAFQQHAKTCGKQERNAQDFGSSELGGTSRLHHAPRKQEILAEVDEFVKPTDGGARRWGNRDDRPNCDHHRVGGHKPPPLSTCQTSPSILRRTSSFDRLRTNPERSRRVRLLRIVVSEVEPRLTSFAHPSTDAQDFVLSET